MVIVDWFCDLNDLGDGAGGAVEGLEVVEGGLFFVLFFAVEEAAHFSGGFLEVVEVEDLNRVL